MIALRAMSESLFNLEHRIRRERDRKVRKALTKELAQLKALARSSAASVRASR